MGENAEPDTITVTIGMKTIVIAIIITVVIVGFLAWYSTQTPIFAPQPSLPTHRLDAVRDRAISYIKEKYPEVGQQLAEINWIGKRHKKFEEREIYKYTGDSWEIIIEWALRPEIKEEADILFIVTVQKKVGYETLAWKGLVYRESIREIYRHF